MKGNAQVLDALNAVLTAELTAVNQYFVHAKMCRNWAYERLAAYIRKESIDEMKHADQLIDRILYLEGTPNVQRYHKVTIGETVPEMLRLDLDVEREAIPRLNDAIKLCRDLGDHGSEELLRGILVSEEAHVDWLEAQLEQLKQLGEGHYLSQQVRG
ncbi:MAG: bacterioferritin [Deltaproteobacteria bacterium]|nr:bacterioferritin [Deltaproteobacteria bacterium]